MDDGEIKNFTRDTIGSLAALEALLRFDWEFARRSYSDLFEWYNTHRCADLDREKFERFNQQITSAHANDSCINYLFQYAVHTANVQHLVHCLDSALVLILLANIEHKSTAKRLRLIHNGKMCFSAQSSTLVVLVPLHNEKEFHWSTLAFYRILSNVPSWYAVHYDTAGKLNVKQAQRFCNRLRAVMASDIDDSVLIYDQVAPSFHMYMQPDKWSCGYRSAVMASLISRMTAAYAVEEGLEERGNDDDDDDDSVASAAAVAVAPIEPDKIIALRVVDYLKTRSMNELDNFACSRFLAAAIDHARSHELIECIRGRLEQI